MTIAHTCIEPSRGSRGESNHIQLKLITEENNVILFKIKRTTYLRKLMRAYSDRAGLNMEDLIFKRQGEVIYESDTALSCELVENDVIEVAKIN